jgi:polyadenylate-binding protein
MEFLSKFGVVVRLTLKKSRNPKFKVQFSFVHYQIFEDAMNAQTRLYD